MLENKKEWKTPKVEIINLKKYGELIIANARSEGACSICGFSCSWEVGSQCSACWKDF